MGLFDLFRRRSRPPRQASSPAEMAAKKRRWLEALIERETSFAVRASLLAQIIAAQRAGRGDTFAGLTVTGEEARAVLEPIDAQGRFDALVATLESEHGSVGRSLAAEAAQDYGVEVEGAVIRTGRRRLTLEAEPPPRRRPAGRGSSKAALDLESELARRPGPIDTELALVYADALQAEGDALGELIVLDHNGGDRRALLGKRVELAGELVLEALDARALTATWSHGFVVEARLAVADTGHLDFSLTEVLESLLVAPVGRLLRDLTFGLLDDDEPPDYAVDLATMADVGPLPALRRLFVGDFVYPDEVEMSWTHVGDAGGLWAAAPNLEALILQGGSIELGSIDAPRLRRLALRTGGLPAAALESVIAAEWPALETLELWFGDEDYGGECIVDDVLPLLASSRLPSLRALRLMNADFTDELIEPLASAPLLPQLEELDLRMGTMSAVGVDTLLARIDAFTHLARLDLADNCIAAPALSRLADRSFIVRGAQKDWNEDYRYVSVSE